MIKLMLSSIKMERDKCIHIWRHIHIYIYTSIYTYVNIFVYLLCRVCIYIYIYRDIDIYAQICNMLAGGVEAIGKLVFLSARVDPYRDPELCVIYFSIYG